MEHLAATDQAEIVAQRFRDRYGYDPEVIGRAPGRVNLIGEHTDYNGGLCLPIALPHAAYAALSRRTDGRIRIVSDQTGSWEGTTADLAERTGSAEAYVRSALWAVREARVPIEGADLYIDSQVPMGSGLSSSAALICAVAIASAQDEIEPAQLVELTIRAETEGVGAPTGGLDQTVSVLAEAGSALLLDFGRDRERVLGPVTWQPERDGLALLVVDTRVRHSHAGGGYGDRRAESEAAADALGVTVLAEVSSLALLDELEDPRLVRRARHVISEIERVRQVVSAVEASDWARVGELFNASHASLRDDFEVSCAELDTLVTTANRSGALGARMTGGGFGGSGIVLVEQAAVGRVSDAVTEAFAAAGFKTPTLLDAPASRGATFSRP